MASPISGLLSNRVLDAATVDALALLLQRTDTVTISELARSIGRSEAEAARAVERLKGAGSEIESGPGGSVRLVEASLSCWADSIESRRTGRLGRRMIVYRETESTQDVARSLAAGEGAGSHGTVVVADSQTAGRGRMGRSWWSSRGAGLLLTAIVGRAGLTTDRLCLAACCAVAEAVEEVAAGRIDRARVRWPNDVLIGGAKVAGVLIDSVGDEREGAALIGIGVNVSDAPAAGELDPADGLTRKATCLSDHAGPVHRLRLLEVLLNRLEAGLNEADEDRLHEAWRERSSLLGRRVEAESGGRRVVGRVVDVDPRSGLMVQPDHGGVAVLGAATTRLVRVW